MQAPLFVRPLAANERVALEAGLRSARGFTVRRCHILLASADGLERLQGLLHQSPRVFGKATSVWTLELAAEVSFAQGLTRWRVSDETIRAAMAQLGVRWKRAKHWITSPDPAYLRKKSSRPSDAPGSYPAHLGAGLCR
jgi:hypothetical protein